MKRKALSSQATVGAPTAPAGIAWAASALRAYRTGSLVRRFPLNGIVETDVSPPPGTNILPMPRNRRTRARNAEVRVLLTMHKAIIGVVVTRRRKGSQVS